MVANTSWEAASAQATKQVVRRLPPDISARWAFNVDTLMPIDNEDIEYLQNNTVVQIWLRRVQRRRRVEEERSKTQGRKTRATLGGGAGWRRLQSAVTLSSIVEKPAQRGFQSLGVELREMRKSFLDNIVDETEATSETLLAKPFCVQEAPELSPIMASGEGCPKDLWVLSKSYWIETTLDVEEFAKWASMMVAQHQKVRKDAGILGSNPLDAGKPSSAQSRLRKVEQRLMARGSLPFAVPIAREAPMLMPQPPSQHTFTVPVQPRGPAPLPLRPNVLTAARVIHNFKAADKEKEDHQSRAKTAR